MDCRNLTGVRTAHGSKHDQAGKDHMSCLRERLLLEKVVANHLATYVILERDWKQSTPKHSSVLTGCGHICAEAEACNIDEQIVGTEVI